jgi:2-oxoglutarate ferredoxin oxidoreductase subunit beta
MADVKDFTGYSPTWCSGCGNWGILNSLKQCFIKIELDPSGVIVVFGIGCSGNTNDFLNCVGFHALHGRAVPNAIGMKIANHKMPVIAVVGDGDCYGEGGNHFIHACRGNHDITVIVHDNRLYSLTTGQVSPTSPKKFKSKSTPEGVIESPLNPLSIALLSGATFVAQTFAGDLNHMTNTIIQGIKHKGFSLINVLQPCPTFNKINTFKYYLEKSYKLSEDYKSNDFKSALNKTLEFFEEKYPLGILYQVNSPSYTDQLPQLKESSLVSKKRFTDFESILKEFK